MAGSTKKIGIQVDVWVSAKEETLTPRQVEAIKKKVIDELVAQLEQPQLERWHLKGGHTSHAKFEWSGGVWSTSLII